VARPSIAFIEISNPLNQSWQARESCKLCKFFVKAL